MLVKWEFDQRDIDAVKEILNSQINRRFVKARIDRNINGKIPEIDEESIWITHMMCLLSSQQRSDHRSPISRFLFENPFTLRLEVLRLQNNVREFVFNKLNNFGGIRFANTIAERTAYNFMKLENGGWHSINKHKESLLAQRINKPTLEHRAIEVKAANYISSVFKGFGPKQSRNFWQSLGLFRYQFVLDSRITRWIRENIEINIPILSGSLAEEEFYVFVSQILGDLCQRADVLPGLFDAAVFASFDQDEWPADVPVW